MPFIEKLKRRMNMQVLLVGKKANEMFLTKCKICESILSEKKCDFNRFKPCPICNSTIEFESWRVKGSAEYDELEKEIALYSI
jgi:hypothetical protein